MRTYGLRFDVNCSILFTELPLLKRPAAARAAGFDAVEFWWPFAEPVPPDREVDAFVGALDDAGVRLVLLNFAGGDLAAGDRGLLSLPAGSAAFRDNIDACAGIAARTGCGVLNALYGNRADGLPERQQDELAAQNLVPRRGGRRPGRGHGRRRGAELLRHPARRDRVQPARAGAHRRGARRGGRQHRLPGRPVPPEPDGRGPYRLRWPATLATSRTSRSPTCRAAAPRGPASWITRRCSGQLAAQGYQGWIGCEYQPSDPADSSTSFGWRDRAMSGSQMRL